MSSANVARHLREAAGVSPAAPAVRTTDGRVFDFATLDRDTDACAAWFESRGIRPGMRVLLMVKPGLDLILCSFALFKLGAPPVAIDPGMGLKNFLNCVATTEPDALVGIPVAHVLASVFSGHFRPVRTRVVVGTPGFRKGLVRHRSPSERPVYPARSDELAAILFTSGSTGAPKGVRYEHGMFDAQLELVRTAYAGAPGETDLPMLPLFALFNPALRACTVMPEMNPSKPAAFDPVKLVALIREAGVTTSFGSPALWRKLARHLASRNETLPGIRRVLTAGAPVPASLHRELKRVLPGAVVHTPYGATECLPVCSITGDEVLGETRYETEAGRGTCVGRPLPGVRIAVIPATDGIVAELRDRPPVDDPEFVGEIIVNSPACTREYDRRPDATAASKIRDGDTFWHRMGDMGRIDASGRLWFYGRKAERVLTSSGVLYTEPVEAVFDTLPGVRRSALIGPVEAGRQIPVLAVEPEPDAFPRNAAARERFVASLKAHAAKYAHTASIDRFVFEKTFPVDVRHNAKIHRLTLAKKYS